MCLTINLRQVYVLVDGQLIELTGTNSGTYKISHPLFDVSIIIPIYCMPSCTIEYPVCVFSCTCIVFPFYLTATAHNHNNYL